ncbi:polyisoprenoid-binding protein YceI [Neolewinella xylanilytica]|uniref:Polyisoprenoid-binding protein YceI n=1 Tax=Neolewinella xylanilytica TaxID=1514080 RepID=A0A2S6I0X7_9BACT|nr:YceI family protein [Neolewinella xylanilytica]PPK84624.1 polyisoprenoid-binding protein YceI [Neolewinella xylanilytica]
MVIRMLFLAGLLLLSVAMARYQQSNYTIGQNYAIRFSGSGAEGTFRGLTGSIRFDPEDLVNASMNVRVEAATIATGNNLKDKHARGENWFDVAEYPDISYRATAFAPTASGYVANGTLTLHGVSQRTPLPFTFTRTADGGQFEGRMTVDRGAFGIEGPWLAFTVGDAFEVEIVVPVTD